MARIIIYIVTFFVIYLAVTSQPACCLRQIKPNIDQNQVNSNEIDSLNLKNGSTATSSKGKLVASISSQTTSSQNKTSDDQQIELSEVQKSFLRSIARFSLDQTELPKYVTIDTALLWIDLAAYKLSKISTLIAVTKSVAIAIVSILIATFFFPNSYQLTKSLIIKNTHHLTIIDQFIPGNIDPESFVDKITMTTDQMLDRFGFTSDKICRESSFYMLARLIQNAFPEATKIMASFVAENLPKFDTSRNKYTKAFAKGIYDKECTTFN